MTRFRTGRPAAVLVAAIVALGAAGCGGGEEGGEQAADTPTATPTQAGGGGEGGGQAQERFASTCGGCHTLEAAGTNGTVGPNLDELRPDKDQVLTAIAEGPGQMPENLLEGADAEAVAEYVAQSAGG